MQYRFEYRRYCLPFRLPLRTSQGPWSEREGVLVRLTDEGGRAGYGEAAPIPWYGTETANEIETVCRGLGEQVTVERLTAVASHLGCLRHALAAALAPSSGHRDPPAPLGVAALLPAGRAALAAIPARAEAGFRIFKWKVGVETVADELGLLDDVCAALPGGGQLRLDANGAWDRRQAERWLDRCADRPVEHVEQPVPAEAADATDLLLGLAGDYPTPIALDESIAGEGDLERWLAAGWPGVYVVKPSLLANVAGALDALLEAKAAVVFSSALETALGARQALRAAFAWTGERRAVGFGVWPLFADARFDGLVTTPFIRWDDLERINPEAIWNALT
ncbi:MAG: o-succinylbenzoate synthase [Verrucomicrobia bacterium]|nr:o-succinylbenzoate synthase [Verrucomicrobiota bacterium]